MASKAWCERARKAPSKKKGEETAKPLAKVTAKKTAKKKEPAKLPTATASSFEPIFESPLERASFSILNSVMHSIKSLHGVLPACYYII